MIRKKTLLLFDKPEITVQPIDMLMAEGFIACFYCGATGMNVKYQWQVNSGSGWSDIEGATEALYRVIATADKDGYLYRCKVKIANLEFISDAASLTVVIDEGGV